jgi:hypothetical protein
VPYEDYVGAILVRPYDRALDMDALTRPTRVDLPGPVQRRVLFLDLETLVPPKVRAAAMVLFMFLFGCRIDARRPLRLRY